MALAPLLPGILRKPNAQRLLLGFVVTFGLGWFAREGFPEGEVGRLLALMHEIDHNGLGDLLTPLRRR